jgi:hypothetical protein
MTYKLLYKDASEQADENIQAIVSQMRVSHVCWLCYQNEKTGQLVYARFLRHSQRAPVQLVDVATGEELTYSHHRAYKKSPRSQGYYDAWEVLTFRGYILPSQAQILPARLNLLPENDVRIFDNGWVRWRRKTGELFVAHYLFCPATQEIITSVKLPFVDGYCRVGYNGRLWWQGTTANNQAAQTIRNAAVAQAQLLFLPVQAAADIVKSEALQERWIKAGTQTGGKTKQHQPAASSLTYPTLGRPTIPVKLRCKGKTINCQAALLDSGSPDNWFHLSVAQALGLDLTGAPTLRTGGIAAGKEVTGYQAEVEVEVNGRWYPAPIYFSADLNPNIENLFGQRWLTTHFVVTHDGNTVMLTPKQQPVAKPQPSPGIPSRTPPAGESRLGKDSETGEEVRITQAARRQGLYIIGANGTGKTGLIENLISDDIKQGLGVMLLDPHSDLTNKVIARLPDNRLQDVILLDIANEEYPFGLNLFTCKNPHSAKAVQEVVDQVMHIFEKLFETSRAGTPLLLQYLRNCTYTLVANPGYTMADIPLLLTNDACRRKLVANVTHPHVRQFWQEYDDLSPKDRREERASIQRRIEEFLQPLTHTIVGQSHSTIDLSTLMHERKIVLVTLSPRLESVTSLIGSVLIALLLNAAYARADLEIKKRKQFNLYADEFQRFATEDFATLLTEARKFGIATTIAHQARFQPGMTDGIRATTVQAANLVVFRVSGGDAQELATQFDCTPPPAWEEEVEKEWFEPKIDVLEDGEEEIKVISHRPVMDLERHTNPEVRAIWRDYLRPIREELVRLGFDAQLSQLAHTSLTDRAAIERLYSRNREAIDEAERLLTAAGLAAGHSAHTVQRAQALYRTIWLLDSLLTSVMEGRQIVGEEAFGQELVTILRSWFDWSSLSDRSWALGKFKDIYPELVQLYLLLLYGNRQAVRQVPLLLAQSIQLWPAQVTEAITKEWEQIKTWRREELNKWGGPEKRDTQTWLHVTQNPSPHYHFYRPDYYDEHNDWQIRGQINTAWYCYTHMPAVHALLHEYETASFGTVAGKKWPDVDVLARLYRDVKADIHPTTEGEYVIIEIITHALLEQDLRVDFSICAGDDRRTYEYLSIAGKSRLAVLRIVSAVAVAIAREVLTSPDDYWWSVPPHPSYPNHPYLSITKKWARAILAWEGISERYQLVQWARGYRDTSGWRPVSGAVKRATTMLLDTVRSFGGDELLQGYLIGRAEAMYQEGKPYADWRFPEPPEVPVQSLPAVREAIDRLRRTYWQEEEQAHLKAVEKKWMEEELPDFVVRAEVEGRLSPSESELVKQTIEAEYPPKGEISPWLREDCTAILTAAAALFRLCQLLSREENKIWVHSTQYQPRKRTQLTYHPHPRKTISHPQPTYTDMAHKITNELANLANFTARSKYATEQGTIERTIRTLEPERGLPSKAVQERIATLIKQNLKDGYLRRREDVEEEIRLRQEGCSGTLPSQPPQRFRPEREV